jgi:hypothetical protein
MNFEKRTKPLTEEVNGKTGKELDGGLEHVPAAFQRIFYIILDGYIYKRKAF